MLWENKELPQGSPEWLDWRRQGIGGSTVYGLACHPETIPGLSPAVAERVRPESTPPDWVSTPRQTWREYFGAPRSISRFHTERGHRLEPVARELLEETLGFPVKQVCLFPDERPVCRVSLDGFCFETGTLLEVKAPFHRWEALPDYVVWQTAYQVAACEAAGLRVGEVVIIEVYEDAEEAGPDGGALCKRWNPLDVLSRTTFRRLGKSLMVLAEVFYQEHLVGQTPPGYTTTEVREVDFPEWTDAATAWLQAKDALEAAEEVVAAARERLDALAHRESQGQPGVEGAGVRVRFTDAAGSIDYKAALAALYPLTPESALNQFRRNGRTSTTIRGI